MPMAYKKERGIKAFLSRTLERMDNMVSGELVRYEHIEICSSCGERYLEKLPKQRGAKYLCPKCYDALKSARLGAATLICPNCGKPIAVQISEG